MAKTKSIFEPENLLPKIAKLKEFLMRFVSKHKKLAISVVVILLIITGLNYYRGRKTNSQAAKPKSVAVNVDKGFEFVALNNQGKAVLNNKIKFKIVSVEKTNQVSVKDQVFTAKNNKLFLIVNLELKNDASQAYNQLPGDLVRLVYNNDEENKYAPDLHNNLVNVAAISTKIDKIGFVIPDNARDFKLYVGELEGKKETVLVSFPS